MLAPSWASIGSMPSSPIAGVPATPAPGATPEALAGVMRGDPSGPPTDTQPSHAQQTGGTPGRENIERTTHLASGIRFLSAEERIKIS